jgi:hypothetical protein
MSERKVKGVGRDAPVVTNANGGKQSGSPYRADLFPPRAFLSVSEVLAHGARKYGEDNWRRIEVREHLNHCLAHLFAYLAGDGSDDHLEHAACRAAMALEIKLVGVEKSEPAPAAPARGDWPPGFVPPADDWRYSGDGCDCYTCRKYRACLAGEAKCPT